MEVNAEDGVVLVSELDLISKSFFILPTPIYSTLEH